MDHHIRNQKLRSGPKVILLVLYVITFFIFYLTITFSYKSDSSFAVIRLVLFILFIPIVVKYLLHLFIAPFYGLVHKFRINKDYQPRVSVLIPAYNEEVGIKKTIQSVINTQYSDLEVIIINDGSTDNTHSIVSAFIESLNSKKNKFDLKYLKLKNGGKAKALNQGLKKTTGEIIVTIDGDSIMGKDAIHNILKHYTSDEVGSVAGNVVIGNRTRAIGLLQQLEYLYGFYFKRAEGILNAVYIVGGAAASYRKNVLDNVGGFELTTLTEDIELSTKIQDYGYKVRYAADALFFTEGPSDLVGLSNQRLRWKYGRLQTFLKYKHLFFSFKSHHNPYLSFVVLPIALFAEILLFFEFILLSLFAFYTINTFDFIPITIYILFLTMIICLQVIFDSQPRNHFNIVKIAPVSWILFYFIDFIEYQALLRSFFRLIRNKEVKWQKWNRTGIH